MFTQRFARLTWTDRDRAMSGPVAAAVPTNRRFASFMVGRRRGEPLSRYSYLGAWQSEQSAAGGSDCSRQSFDAKDFARVCSLLESCDELESGPAETDVARYCLWESDSSGVVSRPSFDFDEVNAAELDIPCLASELEQQLLETESQQHRQAVCNSYSGPSDYLAGAVADPALISCCSSQSLQSYSAAAVKRSVSHWAGAAMPSSCKRVRACSPVRPAPAQICGVSLEQALQNAHAVQQKKSPEFTGNWRGCKKSARCDREFSHRGMCNKKAKIPGTAAWDPVEVAQIDSPCPCGSEAEVQIPSAALAVPVSKDIGQAVDDSDQGSATNLEAIHHLCSPNPLPVDPMVLDGEAEVTGHLRIVHTPARTGETTSLSSDEMAACSDDESDAANAGLAEELDTANETEVQMSDDGCSTEEDETAPVEVPVRIVSGGKVKPGVRFLSMASSPSLPFPPVKEPAELQPASSLPAGTRRIIAAASKPPPAPLSPGLVTRKGAMRGGRDKPAAPEAAAAAAAAPVPRPCANSVPAGQACTQCFAQATPVWRAGPMGPKTLCNACGVRWTKDNKRRVR